MHKHGKEVACPCPPLGGGHHPPWARSGLPGHLWSLQASLPRGPRCPSCLGKGMVCRRVGWDTQGEGCRLQPARPQRAGTWGTLNFQPQTGAGSCFQAGPRGAGANRGAGKALGACWRGGCMDWFHISPTLPSSSPHPPCKRCPKTGGRQGRGPGRRGAEWGQELPKGEAIPIQTHGSIAPGHSLFGGAEGGRISPCPRPTHGSAGSCRGGKKYHKPKDQSASCNPRQ